MVTVAILDSGLAPNRPEFPNVLPGHNFSLITRNPHWIKGMPNREFWMAPDPHDTTDDYGHGTHVAGIVVANAPNVRILPVKVSNASGQSTSGLIEAGIRFAIEQGAKVINISLGSPDVDSYADIVDYVEASGVTLVCAAGNDGSLELYYPGASEYSISVGALNHKGDRCSFSNHGKWVDCWTLGQSVDSTVPNYPCPLWSKSGRRVLSGTSMAAPLITAFVAGLYESFPNNTPADIRSKMTHYHFQPVTAVPISLPIPTKGVTT